MRTTIAQRLLNSDGTRLSSPHAKSTNRERQRLCLVLVLTTLSIAWLGPSASAQTNCSSRSHSTAIPFEQIGAVAGKQYSGDGLAVTSSPEGARLRCAFQRLNATVTTEGLWLVSTKDGAKGQPFRVMAGALGRAETENLPSSGKVAVDGQTAQFVRPGLIEEYSVGIDGLRQDFVIEQRPKGNSPVRLELEVDGAKAIAMAGGARLVLADGGRNMVYNRIKAIDVRGKQLTARLDVMSAKRLVVILDDAAAEYPVRIDPTFSDANWSSSFGFPGANGDVSAVATDGAGNIYVGGTFTAVGSVLANSIAKWNGNSWSALGSGIYGQINALAVSGSTLYAGGLFGTAGNVTANNIAQWNGSSWSALGSGVSGGGTDGDGPFVSALAISGSTLYAGGDFSAAGVVSANCVAQWNGNSWSALGSGIDGQVNALAVSGSTLYAGGLFGTAGNVTANNVAQWNGSSWSALGSGVSGGGTDGDGPFVLALAISGSTLYAGGDFSAAGVVSANCVAQWNGSAWSALGLGMNGRVAALAVSGSTLYAGGTFTTAGGASATNIAHWNGSAWSALGSGVTLGVDALALSGTNLYVAAEGVARWNGSSWSGLDSGFDIGMNDTVYALAVSGTNLYAGGSFSMAGVVSANCVAQWNGSAWSAVGLGINGQVDALAVSGSTLYAGGTFSTAGNVTANNIAQWNGSSWSALGSGINGQVDALAVSGTNLYAGGLFTTAGGVPANYVAKWNGNSWSALGSGMSYVVSALAVSGSTLYAGGRFTTAGGVSANFVAEWNGNSWSAVGPLLLGPGSVSALAVSGSNLYVGGRFGLIGLLDDATVDCVAQWNGSSWSFLTSDIVDMEPPSQAVVTTLAVSGTTLYAGGVFTIVDGASATNIAQWNGSSWSALGSGVGGPVATGTPSVYALAVSGTNLYAGGKFITAGTNVSANIAEAIIPPITVALEPTNEIVFDGQGASFTAFASGAPPLSYQWQFNGANLVNGSQISGATGAVLTIANAGQANAGGYDVVVTNEQGSVTSSSATLTVIVPPSITRQPADTGVPIGGTVVFDVGVSGTPPFGYQWLFAGGTLAGETNAAATLTDVTTNDTGDYWVIVTNLAGSVTSSIAVLTVGTAPTILAQPLGILATNGQTVTYSVDATGAQPLSYQWLRNATPLASNSRVNGTASPALVITGVTPSDAGLYSVVVSNAFGSVVSQGALLVFEMPDNTKPTVLIISPLPKATLSGSNIVATGTASGSLSIAAVWCQLNGGGWVPATTANNWSNWSANLILAPYTNVIQACSVDAAGNFSPVATVVATYALSAPLSVQIQAPTANVGTVSPDYNGQSLQVGEVYSMAAKAVAGYEFLGWTEELDGTNIGTSPDQEISFVMQPGLSLTATFAQIPGTLEVSISVSKTNVVESGTFTVDVAVQNRTGAQAYAVHVDSETISLDDGWTGFAVPTHFISPAMASLKSSQSASFKQTFKATTFGTFRLRCVVDSSLGSSAVLYTPYITVYPTRVGISPLSDSAGNAQLSSGKISLPIHLYDEETGCSLTGISIGIALDSHRKGQAVVAAVDSLGRYPPQFFLLSGPGLPEQKSQLKSEASSNPSVAKQFESSSPALIIQMPVDQPCGGSAFTHVLTPIPAPQLGSLAALPPPPLPPAPGLDNSQPALQTYLAALQSAVQDVKPFVISKQIVNCQDVIQSDEASWAAGNAVNVIFGQQPKRFLSEYASPLYGDYYTAFMTVDAASAFIQGVRDSALCGSPSSSGVLLQTTLLPTIAPYLNTSLLTWNSPYDIDDTPSDMATVPVLLADFSGAPLSGSIELISANHLGSGIRAIIDNGMADVPVPLDDYTWCARAPGFQTQSGQISVSASNAPLQITMPAQPVSSATLTSVLGQPTGFLPSGTTFFLTPHFYDTNGNEVACQGTPFYWVRNPVGSTVATVDSTTGQVTIQNGCGAAAVYVYCSGIQSAAKLVSSDCNGTQPPVALTTFLLDPTKLTFTATEGGGNPAPQTVYVVSEKTGTLNYSATPNAPWISVSASAGSTSIGVNASGLAPGTYSGAVDFMDTDAVQNRLQVLVTLVVKPQPPPPPPAKLDGTWTGTYNMSDNFLGTGSCTWHAGGSITITFDTTSGVVTGSGQADGLECLVENGPGDCQITGTDSASVIVTGSVSGSTASLIFEFEDSCNGDMSVSLGGTISGDTITGPFSNSGDPGFIGSVSMTKQ